MFRTRLLSSVVLVAFLLATIIPGGYILAAASLFLSVVAFHELMKTMKISETKMSPLEILGIVDIVAYYIVMVFTEDRTWLLFCIFAALMSFMFVYVFTFPKYNAKDIMETFFCYAYAPLMLTFVYLTRELPYGQYSVWMIFASSWGCDTCAYCVGMLLGKHKMAPRLSPKKSIEGAIGGVLGSAIIGGLFAFFVVESRMENQLVTIPFAVIAAIGAMISQVGDLAASAIKRNQDVKDYGKLIPGHGGVMDRFDSVIFTAPMIYFLTLLLIHG